MRDRASPLLVALALVCASGIVLRFTNPGGKACYLDESATALRVGGHTVREFCDFLENEGPVRPSEVRRFRGDHVCIASRGAAYDGRPYSDVFVLSRPDLPGDEGLELVATLVLDTGGERLWRLDREPGDGGGTVSAPAIPRRGAP